MLLSATIKVLELAFRLTGQFQIDPSDTMERWDSLKLRVTELVARDHLVEAPAQER